MVTERSAEETGREDAEPPSPGECWRPRTKGGR